MKNLASLRRRLDAIALDQLRAVAATQVTAIERLQADLRDAEIVADYWREEALDYLAQLAEANGQRVGLTPCGQVLVIPDQQVPA